MITSEDDTIAAIATPIGEGGISVIRVSGPDAVGCVDRHFAGSHALQTRASHSAHFGVMRDAAGLPVDECVCTLFLGPHSYTGEDVVEVSCHGGLFVTRRILELLIAAGARQAAPGEFTKRAFLNGRMDLSQAEAVASLIHARSERARSASLRQLEGALSAPVNALRTKLLDALGLLELELDFSEEGYEFLDRTQASGLMKGSLDVVNELLATYREGRLFNEGVRVVLAGAPNVGKSSLLNALLNENRAIVTDIPGTTRDTIEEGITISGMLFRIVDTAGLRVTDDVVEQEGVRRTEQRIAEADLVLFLLDATRPATEAELRTFESLSRSKKEGLIAVLNKTDLAEGEVPVTAGWEQPLRISAATKSGLDRLKETMVEAVAPDIHRHESSVIVTNSRHQGALDGARTALEQALASVEAERSSEFVSADLRLALESLGEIVGVVTTDEILNSVFSKFCIGK